MSKLDAQSLLSEQSSNEQNIQEVLQSKDTSHSEDYKNQSVTNNNKDNSDEQENLTDKSDEIKGDENKIHVDQVSTPIESNTVSDKLESNAINTQSAAPEPDDILGNKSLLKQTITPGEPDTRPTRNCLATISYKLYLIDDATSNSRLIETITNENFFIGEYDVLSAIDLTIQLMDRGEHALIDADLRHCYGENGCEEKQIPPLTSTNSYRMKIDLEFHDWKPPIDIPTLNINERLTWGDKKRERGNFLYRRKEYSSATHCYQNALKFLDPNENPLLEEDEEQSPLLINKYIQVQNNLAQVYLSIINMKIV